MTARPGPGRVVLGALLAALAGCGLKGALELPEKSTNVVIRGPQQAGSTDTPAAPAPGTGAPGEAATPPAASPATPAKPATPADDRMPPPPLPGGNPGSSRGG